MIKIIKNKKFYVIITCNSKEYLDDFAIIKIYFRTAKIILLFSYNDLKISILI